jgi:CheY-like chemotaxis protein
MDAKDGLPIIVLLVEDEALLRMFTADVLREEGEFKVIEAASADEALKVLEATAKDVQAVVTDVETPGRLDGFTLSRIVKQAWPHIGPWACRSARWSQVSHQALRSFGVDRGGAFRASSSTSSAS